MTSAFQPADRNEGKYYYVLHFLYSARYGERASASVRARALAHRTHDVEKDGGKKKTEIHYLDLSALIHFIRGGRNFSDKPY